MSRRESISLCLRSSQPAGHAVLRWIHDRLETACHRPQCGQGRFNTSTRTTGTDLLRGLPESRRRNAKGEVPEVRLGKAIHQSAAPRLSHGVNKRTNNGAIATYLYDQKNEMTNNANGPVYFDWNGNTTNYNSGNNLTYDDENRLTLI